MEGCAARAAREKMMMTRAYRRFYAIFGWQPLGVLLAIVLVFALVMDDLYAEYSELDQEIAGLEKKQRLMKAKIGQQKQLEAALKEKQEKLTDIQSLGFFSPKPEGATDLLIGEMQNQVNNVHGKAYQGTPQEALVSNGVAVIRADVRFNALTQQLVTLLDNLPNSPRAVRVNALEIAIPDPAQPAELIVKAVVQGVASLPAGADKQAGAAAKK